MSKTSEVGGKGVLEWNVRCWSTSEESGRAVETTVGENIEIANNTRVVIDTWVPTTHLICILHSSFGDRIISRSCRKPIISKLQRAGGGGEVFVTSN